MDSSNVMRHDSDTTLSFSFPFLDEGSERSGELAAGLNMLSEDSLRVRESVGLLVIGEMLLSRGEVMGDGDSPADASVSRNSTQRREKDFG